MAKVTASSNAMQFSVSEISKLTSVRSPEVLLHGFPWQVEVSKLENGTQKSLAVYLYCTTKDESSNWTATACATIKLLPFNDDQRVIEHYIPPLVYRRFAHSYGTNELIQWNDLLNEDKKYVKDDTIQLEAKIVVEDPNSLNRSILKFESIDCCCQASFQLTVMNVSNLMAVQTPEFIMRGMPWYIVVFKNAINLGVFLRLMQGSRNASCQVTMAVKLVSSKEGVDPIEEIFAKKVQCLEKLYIGNVVSWKEMLKPEFGFVNENSITLKIEIKSDKPVGVIPNADPNNAANRRRFECSICLEGLDNQDMSTTPCGHSFCTTCITTAVRNLSVCPLCKEAVQLNDLSSN